MRLFFIIIWFFCTSLFVEAATYYAREDGDWNNINTWSGTRGGVSCGSVPGADDDVVIDGYKIAVTENVHVNSVVLCADERDAEALLQINTGITLHVVADVTVQSTHNRYQHIDLVTRGTLEVGGNLIFIRTSDNDRNRKLRLCLEEGTVIVTGGFNYTYSGAAVNESENEIELTGDSRLACNHVGIQKEGGGQINIFMSGSSRWEVTENFHVTDSGGKDYEMRLSESAGLTIGGEFSFSKSGGEDLDFSLTESSVIQIADNFTIDWIGSDATGSDLSLRMTDHSLLDVEGSINIDFEDSRDNCDVLLDLDGAAEVDVGVDDGSLIEEMNIHIADGQRLNVYLDRDSKINVFGSCNLTHSGRDHFYIYLNENDDGSTTDAQFNIGGDLTISKRAGDGFRIWLNEHAGLSVSGDMSISISGHDESGQHDEIELNDDSGIQVDGNFSFTVDVSNSNNLVFDMNDNSTFREGVDDGVPAETVIFDLSDGYSLYFDLDGNAGFMAFGSVSFIHGGNGNMDIDLNSSVDGDGPDGLLRVAGDLTITKTDGDRFRIWASRNSLIDVGGDFLYSSTGHDAGSTTDESLILDDDAMVDINGDFSFSMDDPNQNNDLIIDLNDLAVLNTGKGTTSSSVVNMIDGVRYLLRIDDEAVWTVQGDLQLIYGNSAGSNDIGLNLEGGSSAQLHVTGDFKMDNDKNTDLIRFVLNGATSLLDVDGDIDFQGAQADNRVEIELRNTSRLSIGGNFLRNPAPDNYGVLDCQDNSYVEFDGTTGPQNWPLAGGDGNDHFAFQNIIINNTSSSSSQIILLEDVNYLPAGRTIDFINGSIRTGTFYLQVNDDDPASMTAYNEDSYVCGNLRRRVSGLQSYDFPIGSEEYYEPVTITFTGAMGLTTYIDARFTVSDENPVPVAPPLTVNGTEIIEFLDYGYWTLTPDDGAPVYDITLVSRGHSNGGSVASQHAVFKRDAGVWTSAGTHDNSTQTGTGTDAITVKRSGFTGFSDFIIGRNADEPLPVGLISFTAVVEENKVLLRWETQTETGNDFFTVERSLDGIDFVEIARVTGAGDCNEVQVYSAVDSIPFSGNMYYRLKQTDFDGSVAYSGVISIDSGQTEMSENDDFLFYPNPVRRGDRLLLLLNPVMERGLQIKVRIADVTGAVYDMPGIRNRNRILVETNRLTQGGLYLLFVETETDVAVKKLVVR